MSLASVGFWHNFSYNFEYFPIHLSLRHSNARKPPCPSTRTKTVQSIVNAAQSFSQSPLLSARRVLLLPIARLRHLVPDQLPRRLRLEVPRRRQPQCPLSSVQEVLQSPLCQALPRRCPASSLQTTTHSAKLILQIAKMHARLKIVASCVRNDIRFQHVHLAYAPSIVPLFREKVRKDIFATYLDVSHAGSNPAHAPTLRDRPAVWSMGNPSQCGARAAAYARNPYLLDPGDVLALVLRNAHAARVRSLDAHIFAVQPNRHGKRTGSLFKDSRNHLRMPKVGCKWHRTHLPNILPHCIPIHDCTGSVSRHPNHTCLEEPPRIPFVRNRIDFHGPIQDSVQRLAGLDSGIQPSAVPHNPHNWGALPSTGHKSNRLRKRQSGQAPDSAKSPQSLSALLAPRDWHQCSLRLCQRKARPVVSDGHSRFFRCKSNRHQPVIPDTRGLDRVDRVLHVFSVDCQWVKVHSRRNQAQDIRTHHGRVSMTRAATHAPRVLSSEPPSPVTRVPCPPPRTTLRPPQAPPHPETLDLD